MERTRNRNVLRKVAGITKIGELEESLLLLGIGWLITASVEELRIRLGDFGRNEKLDNFLCYYPGRALSVVLGSEINLDIGALYRYSR